MLLSLAKLPERINILFGRAPNVDLKKEKIERIGFNNPDRERDFKDYVLGKSLLQRKTLVWVERDLKRRRLLKILDYQVLIISYAGTYSAVSNITIQPISQSRLGEELFWSS